MEETEIAKAEDFSSLRFFQRGCFRVFAGAHREEESADAEVGHCLSLGGYLGFLHVAKDAEGEGFLLCLVGVEVLVTSGLLLEEVAGLEIRV